MCYGWWFEDWSIDFTLAVCKLWPQGDDAAQEHQERHPWMSSSPHADVLSWNHETWSVIKEGLTFHSDVCVLCFLDHVGAPVLINCSWRLAHTRFRQPDVICDRTAEPSQRDPQSLEARPSSLKNGTFSRMLSRRQGPCRTGRQGDRFILCRLMRPAARQRIRCARGRVP